jgi:hypothetical protein
MQSRVQNWDQNQTAGGDMNPELQSFNDFGISEPQTAQHGTRTESQYRPLVIPVTGRADP